MSIFWKRPVPQCWDTGQDALHREQASQTATAACGSQQVTTVQETSRCAPYLGSGEAMLSFPSSKFDSRFQFLENASGQLKPCSHSCAAVSEIIIDKAIPFSRRKHTVSKSSRELKCMWKLRNLKANLGCHLWTGMFPRTWIIYEIIMPILLISPSRLFSLCSRGLLYLPPKTWF